jgi:hypothetical protein
MDAAGAARRWADAWERAWPALDAGPLDEVYAEDAVFRSAPFRELAKPREYAEWAFADESDIECRFAEPRVSGDGATVEYWATLKEDGRDVTIAGVALLRFGADGRVVEQRDYWAVEDGRREPPPEWGS